MNEDLKLLEQLEMQWRRTLSKSDIEVMKPFIQQLRERVIGNNNTLSGLEISWPEDFPPSEDFLWDFLNVFNKILTIIPTSNGLTFKFN